MNFVQTKRMIQANSNFLRWSSILLKAVFFAQESWSEQTLVNILRIISLKSVNSFKTIHYEYLCVLYGDTVRCNCEKGAIIRPTFPKQLFI